MRRVAMKSFRDRIKKATAAAAEWGSRGTTSAASKSRDAEEIKYDITIVGGPEHTDMLLASSGGKCIGGPDDADDVQISWCRHINGETSVIEGASKGFYQPSIDDIGACLECRAFVCKSSGAAAVVSAKSLPLVLASDVARRATEILESISEGNKITLNANLICKENAIFVGSIPCSVSLRVDKQEDSDRIYFELSAQPKDDNDDDDVAQKKKGSSEKIKKDDDDEDDSEDEVLFETEVPDAEMLKGFDQKLISQISSESGCTYAAATAALYATGGRPKGAAKILVETAENERNSGSGRDALFRCDIFRSNTLEIVPDPRQAQIVILTFRENQSADNGNELGALGRRPIILSMLSCKDRDVLALVVREILAQPAGSSLANLGRRSLPGTALWTNRKDSGHEAVPSSARKSNEKKLRQVEVSSDKSAVSNLNTSSDLGSLPSSDAVPRCVATNEVDASIDETSPKIEANVSLEYIAQQKRDAATIEELRHSLAKREKRLNETAGTSKILSDALKEAQSRVRALLDEEKHVKEELKSALNERDQMARKLQSSLTGPMALQLEQRISRLKESLEAAENENERLKSTFERRVAEKEIEHESIVSDLKGQIENTNRELKTTKNAASEYRSQIAVLTAERNAARQKASSLAHETRRLLRLTKSNRERESEMTKETVSEKPPSPIAVSTRTETPPAARRATDDARLAAAAIEASPRQIVRLHNDATRRTPSPRSTTFWGRSTTIDSSGMHALVKDLYEKLHDRDTVLEEKRMAQKLLGRRIHELEDEIARLKRARGD
eukprot:g625.t1